MDSFMISVCSEDFFLLTIIIYMLASGIKPKHIEKRHKIDGKSPDAIIRAFPFLSYVCDWILPSFLSYIHIYDGLFPSFSLCDAMDFSYLVHHLRE